MQGKTGRNAVKSYRKHASTPAYVSPNQLILDGFETPFSQQLSKINRWVKLSQVIPWDKIVESYDRQFNAIEGRPPISGRVVLGALIIKHMLNLTDEETIHQIEENMFMQYFLGYSSFTNESVFSPTLFVEIRKRLNQTLVNSISELVVSHQKEIESNRVKKQEEEDVNKPPIITSSIQTQESPKDSDSNSGTLIMDATVSPLLSGRCQNKNINC